jgi:putative inorganic carbon (HCO3(-)) transporter
VKISIQNTAKFITLFEIWIVAAAIGLSMLKPSFLPWAVLVALLFWPVRWIAHGRPGKRTPVDFGVILLIIMIPVTLWATALPELTIPQVYRLALGILFFYALINWTYQTQKLGWVISGILLAGVGLAGIAIFSVQFATTKLAFIPAGFYQRFELLVTDTIHPNVMAGNIVIIIPIGVALLLFASRTMKAWHSVLVLIATLITTGMLVLSQSRGAIMGLGVALLVIVILRWRWGWIAVPLVVIAIGLAIYEIGMSTILDLISSGVSIQGVEGRVEIWSRAIYMIQDFSFTGIGMGSYMQVADLLYPFFLASPGKIEHAHNLFLQVAVDLGIPGLIGWLAVFLGVSFCAWQLYRFGKKNQNNWAAGLGTGFLGCQFALIAHGIMDAVTWGMVRPAPLVWGLWGATMAAWFLLVVQKPSDNPPKSILSES